MIGSLHVWIVFLTQNPFSQPSMGMTRKTRTKPFYKAGITVPQGRSLVFIFMLGKRSQNQSPTPWKQFEILLQKFGLELIPGLRALNGLRKGLAQFLGI